MLLAISLAELNGRNLCNSVPLIGRLQRSGQQRVFGHRLRREFWVDTRRAKREQLRDANLVRAPDDVERNCQIVRYKIGRISIVCVDAADEAGGQKNCIWTHSREPVFGCLLIGQIECVPVGNKNFALSLARRRTIAEPTMPLWPAT